MYVDPITVYREYVQNAADAVDEARRTGLLRGDRPGRVDIVIDPVARLVRVRDNGAGLCQSVFAERLTALRGEQQARLQRSRIPGSGPLGRNLAYCQELVFRSRALGELEVSELRWDCRKLKASLRAADFGGGLSDLVHDVVSVRRVPAPDNPEHFFEVELKGIVRHRNDRLLNPQAVADYLAQVAPVPFSPEFRLGSDITAALRPHVALGDLDIRISGIPEPVFRPHRDWLEIADDKFDPFTDVVRFSRYLASTVELAPLSGCCTTATPALSRRGLLLKGLRLRSGNIQIGDHMLLEELFAEARFNSWAVGEVHVVERRITPNGRRDHFEQSVHVDNLFNHLAPLARDVASRCRRGSVRRRWLRDFDLHATAAREKIEIIAQGGLGESDRGALVQAAKRALSTMEKITVMPEVADDIQSVHCIPR